MQETHLMRFAWFFKLWKSELTRCVSESDELEGFWIQREKKTLNLKRERRGERETLQLPFLQGLVMPKW